MANDINQHLHLPFVFQSSVIDQQIINEAMKTSPLLFMAKPLDSQVLINAIAWAFNKMIDFLLISPQFVHYLT